MNECKVWQKSYHLSSLGCSQAAGQPLKLCSPGGGGGGLPANCLRGLGTVRDCSGQRNEQIWQTLNSIGSEHSHQNLNRDMSDRWLSKGKSETSLGIKRATCAFDALSGGEAEIFRCKPSYKYIKYITGFPFSFPFFPFEKFEKTARCTDIGQEP